MANSTLEAIRTKVRRLTRSLSPSQLSDEQIDEYVNTFVLYDFPEHLRLFNFRTTFTFFTEPYVDTYETSTDATSPLYNFKNKYITVHPPIYIAGFGALFLESREQFFAIYPMINSIASIGTTGDGVTTNFTGTINSQQANVGNVTGLVTCLLRNNVLFDSVATDGSALTLVDYPITNTEGALGLPGVPQDSLASPYGTINYVTGVFDITFPTAPAASAVINSQTVPQNPALPQSLLFFDGKFQVRPVPDQAYRVNMEVYARPTELLATGQKPDLEEWWQLYAYGAAKKVFEDRMDMESVGMIMPEYTKQMTLVLRRTIVQQTSQRAATIYTNDTGAAGAYGPGFFAGGSSF